MILRLRKGYENVDLCYEHGCDTICAEKYEAEIIDGAAVVRFSLRPIDDNQRDDEDNIHTKDLQSVVINDSYAVKRLLSFIGPRRHEFSRWRLEVTSRENLFKYAVISRKAPPGGLELTVQAGDETFSPLTGQLK
ncbi:MAG TPA: hypothetical protein VGG20_15440 [Thermoanaerobaculia bacterium]